MAWVATPISNGWYWHRFFVDSIPIYNMCCVMEVNGILFIHYLGDVEQIRFVESTHDMYWGPLQPPV